MSSAGIVAIDPRPVHQPGRMRLAAHHLLGDRVFVDRQREGAAHPHILERVLALDVGEQELVAVLVHRQVDRAQLRSLDDLHPRAGGDAVEVLRRHRIDHVHLAGEQRRDAGRGIGDDVELGVIDIALGLAPPIGVAVEHVLVVGLARGEHVGAGAHRVVDGVILALAEHDVLDRVVILAPFLGHDVHLGQLGGEDRVGAIGLEIDGEVVDLARILDRSRPGCASPSSCRGCG